MLVSGIERDYIVHDDKNIKGFFGEYRFLSNFFVSPVYFDGLRFHSSEAAYVSAKTTDTFIKNQLAYMTKPGDVKRFGRTIVLRPDWENIKYDVMCAVVFDKFYRNLDLREKLIATGGKYLEESNHWGDKTWGVCKGEGKNWLGKILMKTREFWKPEEKNKEAEQLNLFNEQK